MVRRAGVLLALLTVLLGPGAARSAVKPQVVDPAGDANGLNGQLLVDAAAPGVVTPQQLDMLDIVSATWTTRYAGTAKKRRATALDVTLTLTADPAADQNLLRRYAVRFTIGSCEPTRMIWDFTPPANSAVPTAGGQARVLEPGSFYSDGCTGTWTPMPSAYVRGNSIVFRMPIGSVGKLGTVLKDLSAYTAIRPRDRTTNPVVDIARGPVSRFVLGR